MNQNYNNFNNNNENHNFNGMNLDPIDMTRNYGNQVRQIIQESEVINKSFLFMGLALLLTALSAIITANTDFVFILGNRFAFYSIIFAELAIVIGATQAMKKNMLALSAILFTLYSIINGVTLSIIFFVYTQQSIMYVFIVTSILFFVMAFIGLVTNVDLSRLGGILLMGLVGIIIASVANMFFKNNTMDFLLTILGIGIFMGLTAYDMQKIKRMQYGNPGYSANVLALYGAMSIYLDFINLFLRLLNLLGKKR